MNRKLTMYTLGVCLALGGAMLAGAGEDASSPSPARAIEWERSLLVQMRVSNLDRAIEFYTKTLGFELELRNDDLQWARVRCGINNVTLGLGVGECKGSGTTSLNFGVADIAAARSTLEARGVRFAGPTFTVPGVVMLADLTDPDGNRIRLAQDITSD